MYGGSKASIDNRSSVQDCEINLNVGCANQYGGGVTSIWAENTHHVRLQIHPIVIETDADGEDRFDNDGFSDHEGEDFNDSNVDEVLDDIDNESADDEIVHSLSIENSNRGIIVHNDLGAYMSSIDPNVAHAFESLEFQDIIPDHLMLIDLEL